MSQKCDNQNVIYKYVVNTLKLPFMEKVTF